MKPKIDYSLYLVTDRELMSSKSIEESVERAILGGCTVVQLREKDISTRDFFELGLRVKKITDKHRVPLIINDRVDIAKAIGAAGVHVGQDDMPAKLARAIIGKKKILGVSASKLDEALTAVSDGADYLGVGAVFSSATKPDANVTGLLELKRISENVKIPIVAIGGINEETIPIMQQAGVKIDGAAIVSAIVSAADPTEASKKMKNMVRGILKNEKSLPL